MSAPRIDVVIARDAIERLPAYLGDHGWHEPLVVMDANTREAVGERVLASLGDADRYVFEARSELHAGLAEVEAVRATLGGRPALIAVGSGVITDIVRYAAHQARVPFVSVPSAASMDGYASSVAALQIDGVKVTLPASMPAAIVADPRIPGSPRPRRPSSRVPASATCWRRRLRGSTGSPAICCMGNRSARRSTRLWSSRSHSSPATPSRCSPEANPRRLHCSGA